jgi:hypothetical protein
VVDLLRQFGEDPTVRIAAALVALDVILGVTAAFVKGTFRLVLIGDFLRADVLMKLVPYYAIWATVHVVGDIEIAGFEAIEETTGAAIILALGASILGSLKELGLPGARSAPAEIASPDPLTPTPEPTPPLP